MSLTIKAYLQKQDCKCEIRRFLIDQGASSSFTYLTTKITQVFPSLAGKSFDLFWKDLSQNSLKPLKPSNFRKRKAESSLEDQLENVKISKPNTIESPENTQVPLQTQDEEGDDIAFSSDDELTEALGFVNDGLFRIYIRTKSGSDQNCEELKHDGVVCDGCEGEIYGTRFKCCICPDYDLCCKCETSGKHGDHNMFRIRIPGPNWRQGFMCFPNHGTPPMGPQGPPGAQWRGMKRCWRKWMKKMYEQSQQQQSKEGEGFDCEKEAKEPRKDGPRTKESAEKQGAAASAAKGENDEDSPTEEYLKDVGESVAEMLGPLGIDVNIDVECEGKRKKCSAGGRRGGRGRGMGWGRGGMGGWGPGMWGWGRGGMGGWGRGGMGGWGRMGAPWWSGATESCCTTQSQSCGMEGEKMASGGCCPETEPFMGQASTDGGSSCSGVQTGEEDVPMGSPQRSEPIDGDWMVLTEERDPCSPSQAPAAQAPPPLHPIPKMAHALAHLQSMGFSNDGGWLTQLVESKDGDLNQILDAVKPHNEQTAAPPSTK